MSRIKKRTSSRRPHARRRRNPVARAVLTEYEQAHLKNGKNLLCLIDDSCLDEKSKYYHKHYGGAAPWSVRSGLKFYVWERGAGVGSGVEWIVTDGDRVAGVGELWNRTDGDGLDTGSAVIAKGYRRQGIYTGVVAALREIVGKPIWSDSSRTAGAEKVWRKYKKLGRAQYDQRYHRWRMKNPRTKRRTKR